jgi:hypothetical protein
MSGAKKNQPMQQNPCAYVLKFVRGRTWYAVNDLEFQLFGSVNDSLLLQMFQVDCDPGLFVSRAKAVTGPGELPKPFP